jgi:hypothetical protein
LTCLLKKVKTINLNELSGRTTAGQFGNGPRYDAYGILIAANPRDLQLYNKTITLGSGLSLDHHTDPVGLCYIHELDLG